MQQRFSATIIALTLAVMATACSGDTDNTAATNSNANMSTATTAGGVRTLPDNSEVRTETVGGVTTETRTFKGSDGKVEKVVVTTRDGKRTARVYYRDNTVRELPDNAVESALVETADKLEDVGGKIVDVSKDIGAEVGDKAEDVAGKTVDGVKEVGDKAEDVGDKAASGAKKVGSVTADKAEDVGHKTASGAKKVGKETVKGAKKVGGAIKDAVTP